MAEESFGTIMKVRTLEGLRNLAKAVDAGSAIDRITPEQHAMVEEMSNPVFTEEAIVRLKKRYGLKD